MATAASLDRPPPAPLVASPAPLDEREEARKRDLAHASAAAAAAAASTSPTSNSTPLAASSAAAPPSTAAASKSNNNSSNNHHAPVIPAYPYNVSMSPFIPGHSSARTDGYFEQHVPDDSNVQTRLPSICVDYLSHDWSEDDVWTSWKAMTKNKSEIANGVRLENASWRTWAKQRGRLKTISPETLNWLKDSDVTWLYGPLHTAVDPVPIKKAATAEEYLGLEKAKLSPSTKSKSLPPQPAVKPILKHRSLSEILSGPNSGAASPVPDYDSDDMTASSEGEEARRHHDGSGDGDPGMESSSSNSGSAGEGSHTVGNAAPSRPKVSRTKSDSYAHHGVLRTRPRTGSNTSPPRVAAARARRSGSNSGSIDSTGRASSASASGTSPPRNSNSPRSKGAEGDTYEAAPYDLPAGRDEDEDDAVDNASPPKRPDLASRRSSSHDHHHHHSHRHPSHSSSLSLHERLPPKKKHITFNHRVDQCISLDMEDEANLHPQGRNNANPYFSGAAAASSSSRQQQPYSNQLHRYGPASGSGRTAASSSSSSSVTSSDDDDDEDDDVLTFRSSSPRSPSFVKPFLASPTDPSGPGGGGGPGSGGPNSRLGPGGGAQGADKAGQHIPHTIVKLEPTTLKESELLPGPTPIVVFEDGRVTALYGTEDDYVFDADEHGGMDISEWNAARREALAKGGESALDYDEDEDDEDDDEDDDGIALLERTKRPPTDIDSDEDETSAEYSASANDALLPMDEDLSPEATRNDGPGSDYYGARASSSTAAAARASAAHGREPVTTSDRFAEDPQASLAKAPGLRSEREYFAGPDNSGLRDDFDAATTTSSQSRYTGATAAADTYSLGAPAGQLGHQNNQHAGRIPTGSGDASPANSSSTVSSPGASVLDNNMLLSTSPGRAGIPTKSILKKQRETTSSGEYYPPTLPASTRASRAHAAMFTEDGEEIVRSPRTGGGMMGPHGAGGESQREVGAVNPAIDSSTSSSTPGGNSSYASGSSSSGSSNANYIEPARGRSISRGSSSSSLIDRVGSGQALSSEAYANTSRNRSASGGHSISPVSSYSPPITGSLNSLGAGTAVLQSPPSNDAQRGRMRTGGTSSSSSASSSQPASGAGHPSAYHGQYLGAGSSTGSALAAKPAARRKEINASSSSDEEGGDGDDDSDTEIDDDQDARNMDLQLDVTAHDFATSQGKDSEGGGRGSSSRDGDGTVTFARQKGASSTSPRVNERGNGKSSTSGNSSSQQGFDSRPTSTAAHVGRTLKGLFGGKGVSKAEGDGSSSSSKTDVVVVRTNDSNKSATSRTPSRTAPTNSSIPAQAASLPTFQLFKSPASAFLYGRSASASSTKHTSDIDDIASREPAKPSRRLLDTAGEGEGLDDDDDDDTHDRLFDSPYMPSSPTFLSSSNLPALASAAAATTSHHDQVDNLNDTLADANLSDRTVSRASVSHPRNRSTSGSRNFDINKANSKELYQVRWADPKIEPKSSSSRRVRGSSSSSAPSSGSSTATKPSAASGATSSTSKAIYDNIAISGGAHASSATNSSNNNSNISPQGSSTRSHVPAYRVSGRSRPPASSSSSAANASRIDANDKVDDDDGEEELSDPASNGYSYSYGFDLSDDDDYDGYSGRGVVGRAVGLASALWTVGSSMLWRSTSSAAAAGPEEGPASESER